jgi:BirA family transcriptional regulator, biotin operon repressor / biotin---[acetyl-CoA-carboxylase] ligase
MQLPLSQAVFPELIWLDQVDSTNQEMVRRSAESLGHFSAVVAGQQTLGQGRLGRSWQSPLGSSLSLTVFLRGPFKEPGWVNLLAALAVTRALRKLGVSDAGIKWPNDVLVGGKKISGILSQLQQDGSIILGIGLNLRQQNPELITATSLMELGVSAELDSVLAAIGLELREIFFGSAEVSEALKTSFHGACITLGQRVRAELPGGSELLGLASEIDSSGQLVILTPEPVTLSAADVWHLRS